jgi:hypothetical protein
MPWVLFAAFVVPMLARTGPPFVTDDPEPAEYGRWEVNYALTGTLVQDGGSAARIVARRESRTNDRQ